MNQKTEMRQEPPWAVFPGHDTVSPFWRQEGEAWALHVWLPFWSSLSVVEKKKYLKEWEAPQVWQDFYDEDFQKELADMEGPAGWILRNNLTPCSEDKPRYISLQKAEQDESSWGRFYFSKKWLVVQILVGVAVVFLLKAYF